MSNRTQTIVDMFKFLNERQVFYKDSSHYDKLISPTPFVISNENKIELQNLGREMLNFNLAFNNFFGESVNSGIDWLLSRIKEDISPTAFAFQKEILKKPLVLPEVFRIDLSSIPFGCHETQFRWGAFGEINELTKAFNRSLPYEAGNFNLELVPQVFNDKSLNNLYVESQKYHKGTRVSFMAQDNVILITPEEFNEKNFNIEAAGLIHLATGKRIDRVFRREITLDTLSSTKFGLDVIEKLYLPGIITFEPDLNIIYDTKLGMVLPFHPDSRSYFNDAARRFILPTAFFTEDFKNFNQVFGTDYNGLEDYLNSTSQGMRNYVYKFGGIDLSLSFGGGAVYRTRGRRQTSQIIHDTRTRYSSNWIIQKEDRERYMVDYGYGDYSDPSSIEIAQQEMPARFMLFYKRSETGPQLFNGIGNFTNDNWKVRLKTSNHTLGKGTVVKQLRFAS